MAKKTFKSKAEAMRKGYRIWNKWLHFWLVPKRRAKPIAVKGVNFYCEKQCEEIITKTEGKRRKLKLKPKAEPVYRRRSCMYSLWYDLYRISDFQNVGKRTVIPPREIDLLKAIQVVNRAAKRRRDASQSCHLNDYFGAAQIHKKQKEKLYLLKNRGIKYAHSNGKLIFKGTHSNLALYETEGYSFHSCVVPKAASLASVYPGSNKDYIFIPSRKKRNEPRVKDAVYTLEQLPDIYEYKNLPKPSFPKPVRYYFNDNDEYDGWDECA